MKRPDVQDVRHDVIREHVTGERPDDRRWLQAAIDASRLCPPVPMTYAVGAVIVGADGRELSRGYSRETDRHVHAEESALDKLAGTGLPLSSATMYTSLEPCSIRKSRSRTCTQLIFAAGIGRVVLAMREPLIFVDCEGVEALLAGGIEVVELTDLADQVLQINAAVMLQH